MCVVDVAPMITAFRAHPEQFEIMPYRGAHEFIFDRKSKHRLYFLPAYGEWRLVPACDCQADRIRSSQQADLSEAIARWKVDYWSPLMRQREQAAADDAERIAARVARNKKLLDAFTDKVIAFVTFRWVRRPQTTALVGGDD